MTEWIDYPHANCCPCHTTRKIAYSIEEAAARVGVSSRTLREQIADSYLIARYVGTKALIAHEDLVTWLNSLPSEPKRK
ncbi:helix-turn-helix domain-containing protein [Pseudarthrobacter sp. NS4]|uniref:helix-turn-helix domain-containing protein n=1 Tax=Pseudarthrobacter sp. NS4 TaxID=2973976 RepID=UPI002161A023|nr:helix-turn-helix domain-containing protein [Pseudarthrobacter sp. NS4]